MSIKSALALLLLVGTAALAGGQTHQWPDAPAPVLREELFGIRFRLALQDKGPKGADKFLRTAMAKGMSSEVRTYVAWVSLFPKGWGMEPILEPEQCEPLLRGAIAEGSALAADVLGRAMIYGQGAISRDAAEGMKLLDLAVERGCARALARRGVFHVLGTVGPREVLKGALEVRQAAALGSMIGLMELAELWERGSEHTPANPALALEYYYLLAVENDGLGWHKLEEFEQRGVPGARLMRALAYVRFANEGGFIAPSIVKKHIATLESEAGPDPRVAVELGVARLFGIDWVKRDDQLAKQLFTRAAHVGNEEAKFFLAYMRMCGFAGPVEKDAGLAEMTALAAAGNVRAAARLGYFYYWGNTEAGKLKKDPDKAFVYTRQAAELGSKSAALNLAHFYKHGIGTQEHPALAARLYWIAAECGYYGAKRELLNQLAFAKVP